MKLAIIGGGYMAGIFAEQARLMNIESHCFSLENGIVDKKKFDVIHPIDIFNTSEVLSICKDIKIDGVVATTELTISVASFIANSLGLIGIPQSVAEVITDKYRNRKITENIEGLKHPRYCVVNSISEIKNNEFTFPIIIKPTSKGGKRGVTIIRSQNEIESAFDYALRGSGGKLPLIVEEYIEGGMECSVESLSYHGRNYIIQVTEKITSGPPHCVELAHHQPANLSTRDRAKVESILNTGLTAIGMENGACHTEIKVKNGEIYLIEFNARPGGDHIAHPLIELSTGYPYIRGAIDIALNQFEGVDYSSFVNKKAGVLFVTKQTKELKDIFDHCEEYDWFYKKSKVSEDLKIIDHNDGFNTNYFIYLSEERPDFKSMIISGS